MEAESGPETDDSDSDEDSSDDDTLRESLKALLVCFYISCINLLTVYR